MNDVRALKLFDFDGHSFRLENFMLPAGRRIHINRGIAKMQSRSRSVSRNSNTMISADIFSRSTIYRPAVFKVSVIQELQALPV